MPKITTMKKNSAFACFLLGSSLLLAACNMATPEKYFDIAVLNSNMSVGFANSGQLRELESPSVKLEEGKTEPVAMKRKEVVEEKVKWLEDAFEKVKALKETEDAKDILQASIALYEYMLPVYKNEYTQLAEAYDKGAPKEQIALQAKAIEDKYSKVDSELSFQQ